MSTTQTQVFATPKEIAAIADKMTTAVADYAIPSVMMAALVIVFMLQNPYITSEQLFEGVDKASRAISDIILTQIKAEDPEEEVINLVGSVPEPQSIN